MEENETGININEEYKSNISPSSSEETLSEHMKQYIDESLKLVEEKLSKSISMFNQKTMNTNKQHIHNNIPQKESQQSQGIPLIEEKSNFMLIPKHPPFEFNTKCCLCNSVIQNTKYICIICANTSICKECEPKHNYHPLIKTNSIYFSTYEDIYTFIHRTEKTKNKKNNIVSSILDSRVFNKTPKIVYLKMIPFSYAFSMKPNSSLRLPLNIQNNSCNIINTPFQFHIIAKNTFDLCIPISTFEINSFEPKETKAFGITIKSCDTIKRYHNTKLSLFSENNNILVHCPNVYINIETIEDQEEDELNEYFKNYPQVLVQNKANKLLLKQLIDELKDTQKYKEETDLLYLLELFIDNYWNINEVKEKLTYKYVDVDKIFIDGYI